MSAGAFALAFGTELHTSMPAAIGPLGPQGQVHKWDETDITRMVDPDMGPHFAHALLQDFPDTNLGNTFVDPVNKSASGTIMEDTEYVMHKVCDAWV